MGLRSDFRRLHQESRGSARRAAWMRSTVHRGEEIARQLRAYGIDVQLKQTRSSAEAFRTLANGDFDIGLGGWVADTPDPSEFYESLLHRRRSRATVNTRRTSPAGAIRRPMRRSPPTASIRHLQTGR